MLEWIHSHRVLLGLLSVVTFLGSLAVIPLLIARIPADYFRDRKPPANRWSSRHPAIRLAVLVLKNAAGVVFLLAGIVMLAAPGQGALTMLIGIMLLNFPGKRALEQWIIRRRGVLQTVNWIRRQARHPPLELDELDSDSE